MGESTFLYVCQYVFFFLIESMLNFRALIIMLTYLNLAVLIPTNQ